MSLLECRNCKNTYSPCSDALENKDYKAFCCSETCYKAYIKDVLANREQSKNDNVEKIETKQTKDKVLSKKNISEKTN